MSKSLATESVWAKLGDALRNFIRRRVHDDHLADDLLQETYLRIHSRIESLQDADRLFGWVYQIARNIIVDHFRKEKAKGSTSLQTEPAHEEDELRQLRQKAGLWLDDLIAQLPKHYREVLQLSEIEELTQREVAKKLGLSLSATKSRILRGRRQMKDALEKCCHFYFDQRGNLMDYEPRTDCDSWNTCPA